MLVLRVSPMIFYMMEDKSRYTVSTYVGRSEIEFTHWMSQGLNSQQGDALVSRLMEVIQLEAGMVKVYLQPYHSTQNVLEKFQPLIKMAGA